MSTTRTLDMTAGLRGIWFDQGATVFIDRRVDVHPDIVASWDNLPFKDGTFDLVVFDPPHLNLGNGKFSERYGRITTSGLLQSIIAGSREARRVARVGALMALKWATHDVGLQRVLSHLPGWKPMFGHQVGTRLKHRSDTFWVLLRKE